MMFRFYVAAMIVAAGIALFAIAKLAMEGGRNLADQRIKQRIDCAWYDENNQLSEIPVPGYYCCWNYKQEMFCTRYVRQ